MDRWQPYVTAVVVFGCIGMIIAGAQLVATNRRWYQDRRGHWMVETINFAQYKTGAILLAVGSAVLFSLPMLTRR